MSSHNFLELFYHNPKKKSKASETKKFKKAVEKHEEDLYILTTYASSTFMNVCVCVCVTECVFVCVCVCVRERERERERERRVKEESRKRSYL
uniref:Uncharacterized protein n=1 Tax=Helianthus annuus TaxID=4232 RepID=A0A251UW19_HELAN